MPTTTKAKAVKKKASPAASKPPRVLKAKPVDRGARIDEVRSIALGLADTEERPSYGTPGFFVKKKLFARILPSGDAVVVKVHLDGREALLETLPKIFSITAHYEPYPWVIVNLGAIDSGLLRDVLTEGWRFSAPPRRARAI